jgi:hypothetical protein
MGCRAAQGLTQLFLIDLNPLWIYTSRSGEAISYGGDRIALSGLAVTFRSDQSR